MNDIELLKNILLFKENNLVFSIFTYLIILGILIGLTYALYSIIYSIINNIKWKRIPEQIYNNPKLIKLKYNSDTLETHAVPTITPNGFGIGVFTSGDNEQFITFWDLDEYGIVKSQDEEIWRFSKSIKALFIKTKNKEIKITGYLTK